MAREIGLKDINFGEVFAFVPVLGVDDVIL